MDEGHVVERLSLAWVDLGKNHEDEIENQGYLDRSIAVFERLTSFSVIHAPGLYLSGESRQPRCTQ